LRGFYGRALFVRETAVISRRLLVISAAAILAVPDTVLAARRRRSRGSKAKAKAPSLPNDPVAIVNDIYQRAIRDKDGRVITLSLAPRDRARAFSAETVELWAKADAKVKTKGDEVGPIDFDPVTSSQGLQVKSFKVATEKQDENKMTLAVTIVPVNVERTSPLDNIIRYDFVRENGRWLIDDIRNSVDGKPVSVKGLLSKYVGS
jgi:hypothetical protein